MLIYTLCRVQAVLNSNQDLNMDHSFQVNVGIMKNVNMKGGGGRRVPMYTPDTDSTIYVTHMKKSIVQIPRVEGEYLCCARAIVTGVSKLRDTPQKYSQIINPKNAKSSHKDSQRGRAIAMHMYTGVSADQPVPVREIYKFENHYNVQVIVISGDLGNEIIYKGYHSRNEKVFLYLKDFHYDCITKVNGILPKNMKWCDVCTDIHGTFKFCRSFCRTCESKECMSSQVEREKLCKDCNMIYRNSKCYQLHKDPSRVYKAGPRRGETKPSICKTFYCCPECHKVINRLERDISQHVCSEYFCRTCSVYVEDDSHLCYFRAKKSRATSSFSIYFDTETSSEQRMSCGNYQTKPRSDCKHCTPSLTCASCVKCVNCKKALCGVKLHLPNFIVVHTSCQTCEEEPFNPEAQCKHCGDRCSDCRKLALSKTCEAHDKQPCTKCTFKRELVFKGFDATDSFAKWLLHPVHNRYTVFAHNGRGFDFFFLLNWSINNGIFPEVTFAGARIMSMTYKHSGVNMRCVDSLSFFGCKLKHLPKALGLSEELRKGDFPYLFNLEENFNYCSEMPPLSAYSIDYMNPKDREEFLQFYNAEKEKGTIFDFQKEILEYTRSDVSILRESCIKFRKLFKDITSLPIIDANGKEVKTEGLDCFAFATIASCAMHFLREKTLTEQHDLVLKDGRSGSGYLKRGQWTFEDGSTLCEDDIAKSKFVKSPLFQIPGNGYTKHRNDSEKAIAWLEWKASILGRPIRHSRTPGGEFKVESTNYYVDGYDPVENHILEFLGCFFHSHLKCLKDPKALHPRTGKPLYQIAKETEKRLEHIRSLGFKVTYIWECEYDELVKNNASLKNFLKDFKPPLKPLDIRESLYGGRVEPIQLYYKTNPGEHIRYVDFKSLYPYCNFTQEYPSNHPEVITDQSSIDYTLASYNSAIVKATVIPPRKLYIPTLPYRCNDRLKFPLCATCCKKESQTSCTCTDDQRALTGVWTIMELRTALEHGYQFKYIHELYNFPETVKGEKGLFHEYVTTFLAVKEQASGYPDWVKTENDKDLYIQDFYQKQGIKLCKEKIQKNPALRYIAKSFLCGLWGKFCQRLDKTQTRYIKTMTQYVQSVNDVRKTITGFHVINEDVCILETKDSQDFPPESTFENPVIGCYTTSHGRNLLMKVLDKTGNRILYMDTDSVIFVERDGENTVQEGHLLGDLTNELEPGVYITEFFSSAPKSYGYICNDGSSVIKLKGITRNYINSKTIDVDTMKKVIFGEIDSVILPKYTQICRNKYQAVVYNREQTKKYQKVFTKRAIVKGTYQTLPYGY